MALLSPGVQVSVIDQSNYTPGAAGSTPYILLVTAENKISGAGTGIAPGTLAANANRLFLMTSQRDLLSTFGVPFFYNTTAGTPINGYELNEYGLLSAYSALGVTNLAYVQRANIDLAALTASLARPVGAPNNGTFWLDTTNTTWGLTEWNQSTAAFTRKTPSVIVDTVFLETNSTVPLPSFGSIGDYAVTATNVYNPTYYKRGGPTTAQAPGWIQDGASAGDLYNTWVLIGSDEWKTAWPTIQGALAPTSLTQDNSFAINDVTITVQPSPNNTVTRLVTDINAALNNDGVYAANIGGKLTLFADSAAAISQTFVVTTVANPGTPPPNNIYQIDGVNNPVLNLVRGGVYTFDQSAASNSTHPIAFRDSSNNPWTAGVVSTGTPGTAGAQTVFTVPNDTPSDLRYYCTTHGNGMGNTITVTGYGAGSVVINNISGTPLATLGITAGNYAAPAYFAGPNFSAPRWRATDAQPQPTGSVFQQTNSVNQGMQIQVKRYDTTLGVFVLQSCPVFANNAAALNALDPTSGGQAIPATTTYAQIDPYNNDTSGALILERLSPGPTVITGAVQNPTFVDGSTFTLAATQPETAVVGAPVTVTIVGTTAADFVAAVSAAGVDNVSADVNPAGAIFFTHATGGDIYLVDGADTPIVDAGFTTAVTGITQTDVDGVGLTLSNWVGSPTFVYTASASAPNIDPTDGTLWYFSDATTADIMIQNNGNWVGYQNVDNDVRGFDLSLTNAAGPIFSATAPTTQTNTAESPLVYGDLWIDTADLENYPVISRWEQVNGEDQWVTINNSDQTTINGVLFADARWAPNGTTNPITDPIPPIASGATPLITSNYLDLDAPNPDLYPEGILLFNTRRSGFNVKSFQVNYFNGQDYPAPLTLPSQTDAWVTASPNRADGSPNMGRHAQRSLIIQALRVAIDTNTQLREQQAQFNLIVCPQYPELAPNMVVLNNDRGETAFSIVDTPLRLTPDQVVTWATNNNGLGLATGDGNLAGGDSYAAAFYPSCTTTDLTGNVVVTAPSHMMLRTIIRSDAVAFPWFAPAGLRRGVVDNALQIGFLDATTGEFAPLGVNQGLRDVLYSNSVNPVTFIPGTGITNFGNHTLQGTATALDRINVARLVAFIRGRLEIIGNQYLFEPNDTITRAAITNQITSLMVDLVNKRGLYDYLVVCDLTNNTPATIDANELYVDIAIEPVKAVEFIYIPMRIQNTGTIAAQASA